jgi:nitrite reductase/ring-hydroxylating ferredoxin subunit
MRKSHKWQQYRTITARCPYCGVRSEHDGPCEEGDLLQCEWCHKNFELGQQK